MRESDFKKRVRSLFANHEALIQRKNVKQEKENGVFERYEHPVLTAEHVPPVWRYDFDPTSNPSLIETLAVNAVFNAGAMEFDGNVVLAARVEGADRKSFFGVAESPNGIDNFQFWDYPVAMPETADPDVNVYDMRLVRHEDGWIYGLFCTERKDKNAPASDTSSAIAQCGIARTKDLKCGNGCRT